MTLSEIVKRIETLAIKINKAKFANANDRLELLELAQLATNNVARIESYIKHNSV